MDRFERLLGKNSEPPAAGGQAPAPGPAPEQNPGGTTAPDLSFGLKFVFDSGDARMFTSLPVTIGRADGNDLVIPDSGVSAHHAVVLYDERVKEICILDLDSLNGVTVNDLPTRKNVLTDGARIGLGKLHLVYRDTGYIHPT